MKTVFLALILTSLMFSVSGQKKSDDIRYQIHFVPLAFEKPFNPYYENTYMSYPAGAMFKTKYNNWSSRTGVMVHSTKVSPWSTTTDTITYGSLGGQFLNVTGILGAQYEFDLAPFYPFIALDYNFKFYEFEDTFYSGGTMTTESNYYYSSTMEHSASLDYGFNFKLKKSSVGFSFEGGINFGHHSSLFNRLIQLPDDQTFYRENEFAGMRFVFLPIKSISIYYQWY